MDGWSASPFAVQLPYPEHVPHTDRQGRLLTAFEPEASFFPIGLYHALTGTFGGVAYSFETAADAGHNTVVAWGGLDTAAVLGAAERADLQVIMSLPKDDTVRASLDHPHVLGFDIDHEPSVARSERQALERRRRFLERRNAIRVIDPDRAVFTVDYPTVRESRLDLWRLWKRTGDIASFWTYPVASDHVPSIGGPVGVGETVAWAVEATSGLKPVWFVLQAFESPLANFDWRMPNERQVRAMAYDALVHGATGLIWFSYDSFVTRNGKVIGVSPDPIETYDVVLPHALTGDTPLAAEPGQIRQSRALWGAIAQLNGELASQRDIWLSPTAEVDYAIEVRGARMSSTPVRTQLKKTRSGLFLVGVNADDHPVEMRITMKRRVTGFDKFAGDADLMLRDGRIFGHLDGFATFVLKLSGPET